MKINIESSHNIVFKVESFWSEEGGMGSDIYGEEYLTLELALDALCLARVAKPKLEWLITGYVNTTITKLK